MMKRGIFDSGAGNDMRNARNANGLRQGMRKLTESEIEHLKSEIRAIEADISVFDFDNYKVTGYMDDVDVISVASNVFPDLTSNHPRDLMSERAVLAHEYYGHRAFRGTTLLPQSGEDEYRASMTAAKNSPNLSDEDRRYLVLDALDRAQTAGIEVHHDDFIRRTVYGNSNNRKENNPY